MNYIDDLKKLGLSKQESKMYLFLLQNGMSTVAQIAKGTGIAAPNCYALLDSLQSHHLVDKSMQVKKKQFIARDPQSLLHAIEMQKETAERLIPDLRGLYAAQQNKPVIRFFEGEAGIRQIYLETLSAKKIIAIGSTAKLLNRDSDFFDAYRKKVVQNGIVVYDILTPASGAVAEQTKQMLKGYYESRLLPHHVEDIPVDILVWDDNLALVTLEGAIFGTVLTQPEIASAMRVVFEVLYEAL